MFSRAQIDRGANYVTPQGPGDGVLSQDQVLAVTTAGAGTLAAQALLSGVIDRSGPGGIYNETLETADNLMAANPQLSVGDSWRVLFRNTVAFAATLVVAEGAELSGANTACAASNAREYLVSVLATARRQIFAGTVTNASAVITGLTQAQCQLLMPGMGVTGTNIPAATTVIGVNPTAGTVTMSANATGTALVGATFFPRYNIKGLSTATL